MNLPLGHFFRLNLPAMTGSCQNEDAFCNTFVRLRTACATRPAARFALVRSPGGNNQSFRGIHKDTTALRTHHLSGPLRLCLVIAAGYCADSQERPRVTFQRRGARLEIITATRHCPAAVETVVTAITAIWPGQLHWSHDLMATETCSRLQMSAFLANALTDCCVRPSPIPGPRISSTPFTCSRGPIPPVWAWSTLQSRPSRPCTPPAPGSGT